MKIYATVHEEWVDDYTYDGETFTIYDEFYATRELAEKAIEGLSFCSIKEIVVKEESEVK